MADLSELDEWLSGRTAKAERGGRGNQGHQPSQQQLTTKVGRIDISQGSYHHNEGTGAVSISRDAKDRSRLVPTGTTSADEAKRTRRARISDRIRSDALPHQPDPTQEKEVEVTPQLVQQRMKLAEKLNTIYTSFSETREKKRNDALRMLARDLARLGGSISACGMTGEVKEFVTTLLMLEKVLPTGESGEDLGVNPTQMISDWLNGKGELTGEFDAIEGGK